ncbi:MAG TPA: serine hydrolase domain-containing protein, partial [Kineosporiaceae bacterium]|nr:serine hydrolase domain-containing protein [Kineosporiaceae bacterium]
MTIAGFSKQRLERMHDVLTGPVGAGTLPGLVTGVSRHGETHVDPIGTLTVGGTEPMRDDTIFRIASVTKPITAAAAMVLVEECRLRLDEPVDGLLPELAGRRVLASLDGPVEDTVPARRPITVRDVLGFTLGLGMVMAAPDTYPIQRTMTELFGEPGPPTPGSGPDMQEWIRRVGTLPLLDQPGEQWMYNTGADVLGVLIERASGHPFEEFLAERIFEPLGMVDTAFSVPRSKIGRLATSYAPDPGTGALRLFDEAVGGAWSRPPAMASGAGGLVSTVGDLLAFGRMMLGKGTLGDRRILSRPSVELMTTDQLTARQKAATAWIPGYFEGHGWGFGMAVVTRRADLMSVGSFGWDGGLGTSWYCDPRE